MKKFLYDTLLDEENICNLRQELAAIEGAVRKKAKLVVCGPRNSGKTSLIKNVVLARFKARHKRSFVFFADLMEVKSLDAIHRRISRGFESSFAASFPARHFMEGVKRFLTALRPQVSIDPTSGAPSISIVPQPADRQRLFDEVLEIVSRIARERDAVVVLDEFQDIAFVDEAQGLFRKAFQEMKDVPLIVMGSKRHILSQILAKPDAPLSMFGEDIEFTPIAYEEYRAYILDRFKAQKLALGADDSRYLQDALLRNPEAINIVCAEIMSGHARKTIGKKEIDAAISAVVDKRRSRYEEYLSHFSENEESILASIARWGTVRHPNSRSFLQTVGATSRMVGIIVRQLYDRSILDKGDDGYFLTDPLLARFLVACR